jgi:hypothetical protein
MTDFGMFAGVQLYGWDTVTGAWVKVLVNAAGKLIIDPSEILENPPTNGETAKAPQSDWAYDHWKDPDAHHAQKHANKHLSGGDDLLSWTDEKLLKGAGAGNAPDEIDIPSGGYTEGARVYDDAVRSIPSGSWTKRAFPHERWDTDTIHDNVTNNSRLTCKTAGKYLIVGQVAMVMLSGKELNASILLNGATYISLNGLTAAVATSFNCIVSTVYELAVNDYVELQILHNNGVATNDASTANYVPEFMMQRIG